MIDVEIDVDKAQMKNIEKRLGNLKSKAPTALARAINRATQKAKTETKREVAGRYFITQGDVMKTITLSKASKAKLTAELRSKSSPIALSKFKVSPQKGVKRTKRGYSPSVYKAGVERTGGMKLLSGDPKAFIASMKTGHIGVMERRSARRLPLKQLYGPAVPSMIKNEEVIGRVEKAASETLEKRIDAEVNNILQGGR